MYNGALWKRPHWYKFLISIMFVWLEQFSRALLTVSEWQAKPSKTELRMASSNAGERQRTSRRRMKRPVTERRHGAGWVTWGEAGEMSVSALLMRSGGGLGRNACGGRKSRTVWRAPDGRGGGRHAASKLLPSPRRLGWGGGQWSVSQTPQNKGGF